eukprot:14297388-Heterocapsa_arctica.AAC.1
MQSSSPSSAWTRRLLGGSAERSDMIELIAYWARKTTLSRSCAGSEGTEWDGYRQGRVTAPSVSQRKRVAADAQWLPYS